MSSPQLLSARPALPNKWPVTWLVPPSCILPKFWKFQFQILFSQFDLWYGWYRPQVFGNFSFKSYVLTWYLWYDFNFIVNFPFLSERHVRHDCPFCPYPSHSLNVALVEVLAVFPRCWYWRMFLHLLKCFMESERDYAGGAMVGCRKTRCRSEDGEWCS